MGGKTRLKKPVKWCIEPTLKQQLVFDILIVMVGQFVACVHRKPHVGAQPATMCDSNGRDEPVRARPGGKGEAAGS